MICIRLNGQIQSISDNLSLAELLDQRRLDPMKVAIAKNLEVIVRSELEKTRLQDGDEVEIFQAVGGG